MRDTTPNSRVRPVALRPENLRPAGFDESESMLPYPRRSFPGYRLLQEYFTFPEKLFFFDVTGLREAWPLGFKNRFELVFLFSPFELSERRQILELGVSTQDFPHQYDADRESVRPDRRTDSCWISGVMNIR